MRTCILYASPDTRAGLRERLAAASVRRRRRAAPPSPLSPLGALSHISQSLTDAAPGCPRTSALIKAHLIDINRQRGHATAQLARLGVRRGLRLLVPLGAPAGSSTFPASAGGFSAVLRSCCAAAWPR